MKKILFIFLLFSNIIFANSNITPETIMYGNCLNSYEKKYMKKSNNKAFAYAMQTNGKSSCGWGSRYKTIEEARQMALKYCSKRKLNVECKVIDENGKLIVEKDDFIPIVPKSNRYLSKDEYSKYLENGKEIINSSKCLYSFKIYLRGKEHQSFYFARDSKGNEVCGKSKNKFSIQEAKETAFAQCKKALKKENINAICKPYAVNFKIVGKAEDFGYVKGKADYLDAIYRGKINKIKRYISENADINAIAKDGSSPIFVAAAKGDEEFFLSLIEKKANPKQIMNDGSNLLIAAVLGENPNIIRYLLSKGFDINTQNDKGYTPLHIAFKKFDTYLIEILMQEGADATIKDKKGVSGYDLAKKWKIDLDVLKKIDINRKKDNCNQVFYAAKNGDVLGLKKLAKLKANFKKSCDFDSITLDYSKDDKRITRILLDNGIDINVKNNRGETALMNAKTAKKVKILLDLGADKMIKDKNGKTAYERVKNDKYVSEEIKDLLKY
ncbi:hypothetical protein CP965_01075 [Halarcobacter mediterraneus]|uniref:Uncharacterized protein n=1 Tax=Halarcobacter mediterraneus TaxID=2023153 RepID=A0A4Q1AZH4_9BACT|nr:ankyrin repeat domain-containing protein [Halarcobacter mediterraneus]RXK14072.1 hypothetical protein CP965_01075 [Halarcobacter mediterraneus]